MPAIRTFVALPSPLEVRNTLRDIQRSLVETGAHVKWDSSDKFHITLKFLGNVDSEMIPQLSQSLITVASKIPCFPLIYESVGAFPDLVRPRVIWAGARSNEVLTSLHRDVDLACKDLKFPPETRAFHPHITLGRVKGSENLTRLTAKVKSITFDPVETTCSEVLLMKSDLRPTGSVYTTLKSFPLKA